MALPYVRVIPKLLSQMVPDVLTTISQRNNHTEDKKAYVLINYAVTQCLKADELVARDIQKRSQLLAPPLTLICPGLQVQPAKQDEFIAAFEKTAAPTKKEEGSVWLHCSCCLQKWKRICDALSRARRKHCIYLIP